MTISFLRLSSLLRRLDETSDIREFQLYRLDLIGSKNKTTRRKQNTNINLTGSPLFSDLYAELSKIVHFSTGDHKGNEDSGHGVEPLLVASTIAIFCSA